MFAYSRGTYEVKKAHTLYSFVSNHKCCELDNLIVYTFQRDRKFKEMLDLFAMLKKGHCDGLKVRIGRLQNLLSSSCVGEFPFNILSFKYQLVYFQLECDLYLCYVFLCCRAFRFYESC